MERNPSPDPRSCDSTPAAIHAELRALRYRVDVTRRRQRFLTLGATALLCVAMAPAKPEVVRADRVEAKEFLIRDKTGVRLTMRLDKDGSVGLYLRDAKGKERAATFCQSNGLAGFTALDPKGKERLSVTTQEDGFAGVFVIDGQSKGRLSLVSDAEGGAGLYVKDAKGAERTSIVTQSDGLAGVFVSDAAGEAIHTFAK